MGSQDMYTPPDSSISLLMKEPGNAYDPSSSQHSYIEVLVDCPGVTGLYTYRLPSDLLVKPGDILSVPFGAQQVGAIAIRLISELSAELDAAKVKEIEDVVSTGFFPAYYWELLNRVAQYYYTSLMQVIRVALPPGLLARSQRRVRLVTGAEGAEEAEGAEGVGEWGSRGEVYSPVNNPNSKIQNPKSFLSPAARQILALLQAQPQGDYSWQYLQRQVRGAYLGLRELLRRGLVESYLEAPRTQKPKLRQACVLVSDVFPLDLTVRQREVLEVLRRRGGDLWLSELVQICNTSSSTLKALENKGCIVIQQREMLRTLLEPNPAGDRAKFLTAAQSQALASITSLSGFAQVLLHGVTGSGKTEVYLQAIAPILEQGQSALVLVPEIGLTPQLTDRFRARFGNKVCVYHSALSDGERFDTWRQMLTGEPQVVIGTRSAVFAPLPDLGLIILDEEHDDSFKQDQLAPTYHARTVAKWRAELENCPLILGSATPSLETWFNIRSGRDEVEGVREWGSGGVGEEKRDKGDKKDKEDISYQSTVTSQQSTVTSQQSTVNSHQSTVTSQQSTVNSQQSTVTKSYYLSLPERIQSRPLPPVEVVDMRKELKEGNRSIFSRSLQAALENLQEEGKQGILFIHRRGHSTFVSCRSCGYVIECPNCDVSLAYHHSYEDAPHVLRCHYCNFSQAHPSQCPECSSPYLKFFGSGTQRVAEELNKQFPQLRLIRFDSDTTRTKGSHRTLLTRFANKEADLLVGTQMLTKGLDLPEVTLVGVVAADGLLYLPDYRASERAFQTLTQVAGRSGRGDEPGKVIIQTYTPQHQVIEAVKMHQYHAFTETELHQRAALNYPPYGRLILLKLSSLDATEVQNTAEEITEVLTPEDETKYEVVGPAPASILRVANRYRWQILLKFPPDKLPELPDWELVRSLCPPSVSLTIDVDPLNLM